MAISTRIMIVVASIALLASACGSGDEAEASTSEFSGVATLSDLDEGSTEDIGTELEADEAALAFSACMRDEGLDFPDIGVDAEGNLNLREAFAESGVTPGSDGFRAGMEICGDILASAGFGGGRAALADNPEIQDASVEFSECLRDAGYDVGDLTLGGPRQGQAQGDGQARGQGQGQSGFGDRDARIAQQLGLDIDDPAVAATIDECMPILDTALANAGVGQP
ncbi:MAG: hypothetical protein AAGC53_19920 [Actinomycetota bacterium]